MENTDYTVSQSKTNHHIAVFKNGKMVANIAATKELTEEELNEVVEFIIHIRNKK